MRPSSIIKMIAVFIGCVGMILILKFNLGNVGSFFIGAIAAYALGIGVGREVWKEA